MGLAQKLLLMSARHKVTPCRDNQRQQPIGYEFIYIFIYLFFIKTQKDCEAAFFFLSFLGHFPSTCSKNSSMGLICDKTM